MADLPLFDPFKELEDIRRQQREAAPDELSQKLSQPLAREKTISDHGVEPTFATLATLAGGSSPAVLAPARVKEEEERNNSIISYTYARIGGPQDPASAHTPAGSARVAKVGLNRSETTVSAKSGVARVSGDGLREWRAGLAHLSSDRTPCPGYRADEWPRTLSRMLAFLDEFGPQAEALGWTAPRLFGVHAEIGIVRVDHCGGLVLPLGGPVRAITATEISFGHLTHREKPGQLEGVLIWEFGR